MQTQVSTIDFDYLAYAQLRHRRLTQTLAQIRLNEAAASKPSQMRYVSTRGEAPVMGFSDVLLAGLAKDGWQLITIFTAIALYTIRLRWPVCAGRISAIFSH